MSRRARKRAAVCPISMAARRMVVERGYLGITNVLVQSASQRPCTNVGSVLSKMAKRGEIFAASVPGHPMHWFANNDMARRWEGRTCPAPKASPAPHQRAPLLRGRPAPVVLADTPSLADMPAVMPPHVTLQRCPAPTHDNRYQCAPGARPFGAGFAQAGIGRDVTTGRVWGAEA